MTRKVSEVYTVNRNRDGQIVVEKVGAKCTNFFSTPEKLNSFLFRMRKKSSTVQFQFLEKAKDLEVEIK